jgi:type III restriction enzyme
VIRWLRPATAQFAIYYFHNSKRYVPDFVVETEDEIYMIEIKAENEMDDADVQEKAQAGKKFCETASNFNKENAGKVWRYVLLPHSAIALNMSLQGLLKLAEI